MTQLVLDLFGDQAHREDERARGEDRLAAFVARHQIGQIRLPWDTADGDKAGDLIPAWRCCACGGIEVNRYHLEREHNCCGHSFLPYCQNPPGRDPHPYRMDAHWIPPITEDRP